MPASLRYSSNLGLKELHIFEVDEAFLTEISQTENSSVAQIKMAHPYGAQSQRQAMLCTENNTYKLKQSETSNMFMAVQMDKAPKSEPSAEIQLTTHVFVEVTPSRSMDQ